MRRETNIDRTNRIHLHSYANIKRIRRTIANTTKYQSDPFGSVINLSRYDFSIHTFKLLGKNLNFCPTQTTYKKQLLETELDEFFRIIKLRAHFGNEAQQQNRSLTEDDIFKQKSTWEPNQVHHTVPTFCEAVRKDIRQSKGKHRPTPNLTKDEIKALHQLELRDDIIITKADKGGAVVIMNVDDYIKEANRQLQDENCYKRITNDPTKLHSERVNNAINDMKNEGLITEKVAKGLTIIDPKTPKLSFLPKIHKEGNPGRPIIDSVDCHTSRISKYVDFHLQKEVTKLKSYTKDTTDAINKIKAIQNQVCKNDILVTMDVRSLYTNIPNNEGIHAVRETLNSSPTRLPSRVITTFLFLILTLNNFVFNGVNYIQRMGCAMGTKCAPSYANIFMGKFEELHIYPRILDKTRIFLRYIDDLFLIWKGSEEELKRFFTELNQVHPTIKFDYHYSTKAINFLDLTIYKDDKGELCTKSYTKPTDRQNYLYRTSAHPEHLKKNIPYGQALRLKKICSKKEDYEKSAKKLKERLLQLKYQEEEIDTQFNKANARSRDVLLQSEGKQNLTTNRLPCVTTYNKSSPDIKETINKHWDILKVDPNLEQIFQEKPVMAFKRNKNLKDMIGQKTLLNNKVVRKKPIKTHKGLCSPCNSHGNNICCKQIRNTDEFQNNGTKEKFKIFHRVNCRSKFVIYLLECILCMIQYVGKSEWPMNIRMNKHRNDALKEDAIPICRHFNQCSHNFRDHARFTIIEQLNDQGKSLQTMRKILEARENFWIKRLGTLAPNGLNQGLNNS